MNDELLSEYGCMDCIHDDEEDHTESCYRCSWLMGEGKGYPCLFQPKGAPAPGAQGQQGNDLPYNAPEAQDEEIPF